MAEFDFESFRTAVEGRDAERWLRFFADDAEWLEYRHRASSPRVTRGRDEIARYLDYVRRTDVEPAISNEVSATSASRSRSPRRGRTAA